MPRRVVTPENLSLDFTVNPLRSDGPVGLNLGSMFARTPVTGEITVPISAAELVAAFDTYFGNTAWRSLPTQESRTASALLAAPDFSGDKTLLMNVAGANTVTIPPGLTVTNPVSVIQIGPGVTSFVAGSGVLLRSADGWLRLRSRYSGATIIPVALNDYLIIGDLAA